jgi:phospho-N-acetylmuramoyl-pentapeptide-transferase
MLYLLLSPFAEQFQALNLINYLTFRTGAAMMTAFILALAIGNPFIGWLRTKGSQPIRTDGPESHIVAKAGTPTMGGFIILAGILAGTLIWADISNPYLWVVIFVTAGFGGIGFIDDWRKVTQKSTEGLSGKGKLILQFIIAAIAVVAMVYLLDTAPDTPDNFATSVAVPFFKDLMVPLSYAFYLCWHGGDRGRVQRGEPDGRAGWPRHRAGDDRGGEPFGFIAYFVGSSVYSEYLFLNFTPGTGELSVICGAMIGAGLGFLWYNAPPAMVFMGDTGSLSLGGAIGTIAVAVKHEIVLVIIGGLFVLEAVSVMVQVASFKLTGKRVFRMAPIHHHFEKLGWAEPTIVIRFWIIAFVLALIGLSTLKLR